MLSLLKSRRRRRLLAERTIPEALWRTTLAAVPSFAPLEKAARQRLRDLALIFLAEKRLDVRWQWVRGHHRNVGNERGVTGLFTEAYMGTDPASGYFGNGNKQFLSLPRTIGVSLNYRFE